MTNFQRKLKVGFIGSGNLTHLILTQLLEAKVLTPENVYITNRSPKKREEMVKKLSVQALDSNEELVEKSKVIVFAVKPQDFQEALSPIVSLFQPEHYVLSLMAGVSLKQIKKQIPQCDSIARILLNTACGVGQGVLGVNLYKHHQLFEDYLKEFTKPLGLPLFLESEELCESLLISAGAGTGFIFELMQYWQEWLEEKEFEPALAEKVVKQIFFGTSSLAQTSDKSFLSLRSEVASKKGVTEAGLKVMQERVEENLRASFEAAYERNEELKNKL